MSFYRNLSAITYQRETQDTEIFRALPNICLIQFKLSIIVSSSLGLIVDYYKQEASFGGHICLYAEDCKPTSIVLSETTECEIKKVSIGCLCLALENALMTVVELTKRHPLLYGEIT